MSSEDKGVKATSFGSESGHWYNADGLVKSVPLASGKGETTRITVAHARKYGFVPSVTGILKILDKPNLTMWKCKEFVRAAGYVGAMGKDELFDEYFKRVSEQFDRYNDHAAVGTDIHAQIAKWWQSEPYEPIANKTILWLSNFHRQLCKKYGDENVRVESEKPFASPLGFGGTVDWKFITPKEVIFTDFKSTDDDKLGLGDKLAYKDSHLTQLVAYDLGTNINAVEAERKYYNVFIGRLGGEIYVKEWTNQAEIEWARSYFKAALNLFKIVKGLN
jgi:hypothetical protein